MAATYWQGGVCAYESSTRSTTRVELHQERDWRCRLEGRTQRGQATVLQRWVCEWVEETERRLGVSAAEVTGRPERDAAGDELNLLDVSQQRRRNLGRRARGTLLSHHHVRFDASGTSPTPGATRHPTSVAEYSDSTADPPPA